MKPALFAIPFITLLLITHTAVGQQNPDSLFNRDSVVSYAKSCLGSPYKYTAAGPSSFDCSGFVYYVFRHFGVSVPHSSRMLADIGIPVSEDSCMKGDIIIFRGTRPKITTAGHVGIVISETGMPVQFIHASSSKNHNGVVISELNSPGYRKRFIGIRRLTGKNN